MQYHVDQCVKLANVDNCSGPNGGYKYFPNPCIEVITGQTYNLCLTPGYSGTAYTAYWKVWIDFNGDGDFEDAGELFAYGNGNTRICGNVTIPGCTQSQHGCGYLCLMVPILPIPVAILHMVKWKITASTLQIILNGGTNSLISENKTIYRLLCAENCIDAKSEDRAIPSDQQSSFFELNDQLVAFPNPATDNISVALKTGMLRSIQF
ncbi:MAG: hypothetical protein IPG95_05530 [Saprospiraceae bacterium]|nr:hypothetical protein [Saprospiraceae bacterium]